MSNVLNGERHSYELQQNLGEGAHGKVQRALCLVTNRLVACKTIRIRRKNLAMVRQEYRILHRFGNAAFVTPAYEIIPGNQEAHIIMELCTGGTLQDRIEDQGPLSRALAARHLQTLAEFAVACETKGVVHSDLKPDNILLVDRHPDAAIKVTDFGLARPVGRFSDICKPSELYGTLGFTAPEVEKNFQSTYASDIYSIGAILYFMLCADTHFFSYNDKAYTRGLSSSPKWASLDQGARDILASLLNDKPEGRLTATQLLQHPWLYEAQSLPYPFDMAHRLSAELHAVRSSFQHQERETWMERWARHRAEAECDHLCNDIVVLKRCLQDSQDRLAESEAQQGCSEQPREEAQLQGSGVQPLNKDADTVVQRNNALRIDTGSQLLKGSQVPAGQQVSTGHQDPSGHQVPTGSQDLAGSQDPTGSQNPTGSQAHICSQVPIDLGDSAAVRELTSSSYMQPEHQLAAKPMTNERHHMTETKDSIKLNAPLNSQTLLTSAHAPIPGTGAAGVPPSRGVQDTRQPARLGLKRKRSIPQSESHTENTFTCTGKRDRLFSRAAAAGDDVGAPSAKRRCLETAAHTWAPQPTHIGAADPPRPTQPGAPGPSEPIQMSAPEPLGTQVGKKAQDVSMPETPTHACNRLGSTWAGH